MPFIVIQEQMRGAAFTVSLKKTLPEVRAMAKSKPCIRSREMTADEASRAMNRMIDAIESIDMGVSMSLGQTVYNGSLLTGGSFIMSACQVMPFSVPMGRNG